MGDPKPELRWFKPHRLHLSIDHGALRWRFECVDVAACDCHTDGNDTECWIAEQMPDFMEDWYSEELLENLTLDPVRSPLLVELALPGLGPEDGPSRVYLREVSDAG